MHQMDLVSTHTQHMYICPKTGPRENTGISNMPTLLLKLKKLKVKFDKVDKYCNRINYE